MVSSPDLIASQKQSLITGFFKSSPQKISDLPQPTKPTGDSVSPFQIGKLVPAEGLSAKPQEGSSPMAASSTKSDLPLPSAKSSVLPTVKSSVPCSVPSINAPSYAERFKASLRNLRKISSPLVVENGIPVVQAPQSVLLQTAELWKGHIVAHFHGLMPPPAKIYSDLNPAWGKFGNITIRTISDSSCLILIPNIATREWVLQVGYWQAGNVAFSVYPWSSDGSLVIPELATAPTWAVLKNVPPQMYSLDGLSVIASAIGEPLHTEKSRLDPFHFGDTKVKVEICLDSSPPTTIIVRDLEGNSAQVSVSYPRLPPKCCNCGRFGHLLNRCPKPLMKKAFGKDSQVQPFKPGGVAIKDTSVSLATTSKSRVSAVMIEEVKKLPMIQSNNNTSSRNLASSLRARSRSRSRGRGTSEPPVKNLGSATNSESTDSVVVDHRVVGQGYKEVIIPKPPPQEFKLELKIPAKGKKATAAKVVGTTLGGIAGAGSFGKQNLFSAVVRKHAMRKQQPLAGFSRKADRKNSDFVILGSSSSVTQAGPLSNEDNL